MTNVDYNRGAVNAIDALSKGWNLFAGNALLYIGMCVLFVLASCILIVINWFISGPILLGIYYVLLRQMRGQDVSFGMFFKGFEQFFPAMIIGFIMLIPAIINQIFDVSLRLAQFTAIYNPNEASGAVVAIVTLISLLFSGVFLIGSILVYIFLTFALPLLLERKMGVLETLKLSASAGWANAGGLILLLILQVCVVIVGALACLVGLFAAIPILWASNAVAYRQVFPDSAQANMAPPQPEQYQFQ